MVVYTQNSKICNHDCEGILVKKQYLSCITERIHHFKMKNNKSNNLKKSDRISKGLHVLIKDK